MEAPDKSATGDTISTNPSIPSPFANPPPPLALPAQLLPLQPLLGTTAHPTQSPNAMHHWHRMHQLQLQLTNVNARAAQYFLLFNSWNNVDTVGI